MILGIPLLELATLGALIAPQPGQSSLPGRGVHVIDPVPIVLPAAPGTRATPVGDVLFPRALAFPSRSALTIAPWLLPLDAGLELGPKGAPKYVTFPILPKGY